MLEFPKDGGQKTGVGVGKMSMLKNIVSKKLNVRKDLLDKHSALGRVNGLPTDYLGIGIIHLLLRETTNL